MKCLIRSAWNRTWSSNSIRADLPVSCDARGGLHGRPFFVCPKPFRAAFQAGSASGCRPCRRRRNCNLFGGRLDTERRGVARQCSCIRRLSARPTSWRTFVSSAAPPFIWRAICRSSDREAGRSWSAFLSAHRYHQADVPVARSGATRPAYRLREERRPS